VRVTTGVKRSCFYRLPKLQKVRWFLIAAASWRRSTKASLLCSEMTNPRRHRPWKSVVPKRTLEKRGRLIAGLRSRREGKSFGAVKRTMRRRARVALKPLRQEGKRV
jgi:hypothetical protein